jgi:hypothetical protein
MDVLTRPCAIAAWAPVPFHVEGLRSGRLETGSWARVAGQLAGKDLEFEVEVHEVGTGCLRLTAYGPFVDMDVAYDVEAIDELAHVRASVDVKGKGVMGRFVAKAVEGFLAGGALKSALSDLRIAVENPEFDHYAALAA